MQRLKDSYLDSIESYVPLSLKQVLEVGCGNGARTKKLAKRKAFVTAIDPDGKTLELAKKSNPHENITYLSRKAEHTSFPDKTFDIILFTLSFHHIEPENMRAALDEAVRVTKKGGYIIFLEPTEEGTFFDAEIVFDACDGDEREEKRIAYNTLKNYPYYSGVAEIQDETILKFDSVEDFVENMDPHKHIDNVKDFLQDNDFTLKAIRRINIFRV